MPMYILDRSYFCIVLGFRAVLSVRGFCHRILEIIVTGVKKI